MAVYKIQFEKRVPWSFSTSGFYHWVNVYYLEAANLTDLLDAFETLKSLDDGMRIDIVGVGTWRITRVSDGAVIDEVQGYHVRTFPILPGDFVSLANVVRASGLCADGTRWYKMYRFPLREADMDTGGLLSSAMFTYASGSVNAIASVPGIGAKNGSPLVSHVTSPRVHLWQWRDGTKRRSRSVLFH